MKFSVSVFVFISTFATFTNCAEVEDPFEDLNRKFYKFNFEIVDPLVLEPLAKSYEELTPSFSKKVVNNFKKYSEKDTFNVLVSDKASDSKNSVFIWKELLNNVRRQNIKN